jgi:hypothetical protein
MKLNKHTAFQDGKCFTLADVMDRSGRVSAINENDKEGRIATTRYLPTDSNFFKLS